ncbi:MAG: hypothetical protein WAQ32_00595 [Dethiobacteria bacterium]|nr:hypothetical protein [Bacillota bacterium]NMD33609.1 hypothetical protein [Bacillota bacterium]HOB28514.1 hypothetical protein [Bacillota bacterium]HPZ41100.1 hypothetical protein [Bacillota bacterium]HQD52193.1 hypothetical protein [Bacillota bacterium]
MNKDQAMVLARLHLGAILPLLEDIAAYDDPTRKAIANWDFPLQFRLAGGEPATTLVFEKGSVTAHRGKFKGYPPALTFKDASFLNEVFQGKTEKNPTPNLPGIFKAKQLLQVDEVLGRLEYYLKPEPELLANPDTFAFCVRITLYATAFGIKEVGEHDLEVRPIALDLPDGTVEMRVADGPAAHLIVKKGNFEPWRGPAQKPNAILEFNNLQTAWDTFQGNLDTFAAIGNGKIKLRGFIPLIEGINPLMDRLAYYLSD